MNPVVVRNVTIGTGIPKICIPIVGKTREEILMTAREICDSPADLAEWRADWFVSVSESEEVKTLLKELREILGERPLLFTFRTKEEGGEREITFAEYAELLKEVAGMQLVDLIDVEVFMDGNVSELIETLQKTGVKIVGSNHDFAGTPKKEEIIQKLCYMQKLGVELPKIAVMPRNEKDVLTLLSATQEMASEYADRPIITMSMAGVGAVSRVSGEVFGSAVTFGALKQASAPGQIEAHELRRILEILHQAH